MVRQRMNPRERPKRESCCGQAAFASYHSGSSRRASGPGRRLSRGWVAPIVIALLACCVVQDCDAIDRVILEVGQLSTAGVQALGATITLDVSSHRPMARAQLAQLHLSAQPDTRYTDVDITCG